MGREILHLYGGNRTCVTTNGLDELKQIDNAFFAEEAKTFLFQTVSVRGQWKALRDKMGGVNTHRIIDIRSPMKMDGGRVLPWDCRKLGDMLCSEK